MVVRPVGQQLLGQFCVEWVEKVVVFGGDLFLPVRFRGLGFDGFVDLIKHDCDRLCFLGQ